jgi:hypothetical protein
MRHRHRVHELEAEVASLRAHLDQVLEMPDHSSLQVKSAESRASLPQPEDEAMEAAPVADAPAQPSSESAPRRDKSRRVKLEVAPEPAAAQANGKEPPEHAESPEPAAPAAEA